MDKDTLNIIIEKFYAEYKTDNENALVYKEGSIEHCPKVEAEAVSLLVNAKL